MTARQEGLLLIGALLVVSFVFQIQMKLFANEIAPMLSKGVTIDQIIGHLSKTLLMWRLWLVGLLAVSLFAIWLAALTRLELSFALPLASVALVINAIGSGLLLGEALTPTRLVGVLAVAVGMILILKS